MKKLLKEISQIILRRNQNKLLHLCIVGLGNPGDKYLKTRHNVGHDFLDLIAKEFNEEFNYIKKIDADYVEIDYADQKIALIKPREFINRSGKTLQLVRKYKVKNTRDILVVHDDMDLEPGDVKLKLSGGHAGHNGLRDILKVIDNDFVRLRFGIGHPPNKEQTDSWVIKKPNPEEKEKMANAFDKAKNNISKILLKDWMLIMNNLHSNEH
jgi:PTH1 family peptidyl-tRNA hydrolase